MSFVKINKPIDALEGATLNILNQIVLSGNKISRFDASLTYFIGEFMYDIEDGVTNVYTAVVQDTHDAVLKGNNYWVPYSLADIVSGGTQSAFIGDEQPTDSAVNIWYKPVSTYQYDLGNL